MEVLNVLAQVTMDALVQAVARLPPDELDEFLAQVNLIRQRRATEADLLAVIQRQLPPEERQRLDDCATSLRLKR